MDKAKTQKTVGSAWHGKLIMDVKWREYYVFNVWFMARTRHACGFSRDAFLVVLAWGPALSYKEMIKWT